MTRLGFKKSRTGCKNCKLRRVKCDEQVPCSGCSKRNMVCSYLSSPASRSSSEVPLDPSLPSNREDWLLDLELTYHCKTVLHQLGVRESVVHLWQDYIPQQAFKHSFLMHGLLAFAALHLAYVRPDSSLKYLHAGDKHQAIALEEYRSILSSPTVDKELVDALFALSALLSISSMARSCALSDTSTMDMDDVAELFILTRGIQNVIRLSFEHIKQGALSSMLDGQAYRSPEGADTHLPTSVPSRFDAMQRMLTTYGLDQAALGHCRFALTELEAIYKHVAYFTSTADIELGVVSKWQVLVPMDYVKLIQARNPPALVILAHYAAVIGVIREVWYTQNWAEYTLLGISNILDNDMQHWLQWPMEQVRKVNKELVSQRPFESNGYDKPLVVLAG